MEVLFFSLLHPGHGHQFFDLHIRVLQDLPRHGSSLHDRVSVPSPAQFDPPKTGFGSEQVLVLILVPPPHETEQGISSIHWDQAPSTIRRKHRVETFFVAKSLLILYCLSNFFLA